MATLRVSYLSYSVLNQNLSLNNVLDTQIVSNVSISAILFFFKIPKNKVIMNISLLDQNKYIKGLTTYLDLMEYISFLF